MDKTFEDNMCIENATNETAQIIGMTNHAANKCIDLFLDSKGSNKKKVGALTGTDRILFGQIYHVGNGFEDFPQKQMLFNFNWGKERYFNDEFNNEKICYAIRNMLCTGIWS